jgi:hypothetical protein
MGSSYRRNRGILHAENVWSNFNHTNQEATDVLHAIEAWLNPNIFSMLKTFDQAF